MRNTMRVVTITFVIKGRVKLAVPNGTREVGAIAAAAGEAVCMCSRR
jgi:hypothetical protein